MSEFRGSLQAGSFYIIKNHWVTGPVVHTLGIKKIEETSYSE